MMYHHEDSDSEHELTDLHVNDFTQEDLEESLRVLNEVLHPLMHHEHSTEKDHERALDEVVDMLTNDAHLTGRAINMFTGLIAYISMTNGYQTACGFLHATIDTYREKLAELN